MGFTPSLDPLHMVLATEVIRVLLEPPFSTLDLAGPVTLGLAAEPLMVKVAPIREE